VPGSRESSCACACSVGTSSSRFLAYRSAPQKAFHRREVKTSIAAMRHRAARGREVYKSAVHASITAAPRLRPVLDSLVHRRRPTRTAHPDAVGVHRVLLKLWKTPRLRAFRSRTVPHLVEHGRGAHASSAQLNRTASSRGRERGAPPALCPRHPPNGPSIRPGLLAGGLVTCVTTDPLDSLADRLAHMRRRLRLPPHGASAHTV
jgi:hypothetical protein